MIRISFALSFIGCVEFRLAGCRLPFRSIVARPVNEIVKFKTRAFHKIEQRKLVHGL